MRSANEVIAHDVDHIYQNIKEDLGTLWGKRILLTGGAGFLGYYLVQSVLHFNEMRGSNGNISLIVHDNFIRGVPAWLQAISNNRHLNLVKHDVTTPLPDDMVDPDYIMHAASIASPTFYRKYPIETMDANVSGLRILLEYCKKRKDQGRPIEGFLFFSSSEIYGDPPPACIPTPETFYGHVSCTGPRACYDESKRYGETLCVNFARQYGIPVKMARPFNNYGPGLKITDKRVLPDFCDAVMRGRDIIMLSDGSPTRTFCYVADAIAGYFKILMRGLSGEAYNIGVEAPEISMANLAERVTGLAKTLFEYKGRVVRQVSAEKEYLTDNPNRRCPIIAKARRDLGYNPSISLDEGLMRSLLWYRENSEAEEA